MLAVIAEEFAHGAGGVRRDVLHRSRLGSRGGYHDGVTHGAEIRERLHHLRDGGALLADSAVNTDQIVLGIVDDGVERDRGLARLAVTDDQLALAAADGNHGVNGLQSRSHGLAHRLPIYHPRGQPLDRDELAGGDRAFAIDRLA